MKNKAVVTTAILLIIAIVNYVRIFADAQIRVGAFLSILAICALRRVLLTHLFKKPFNKNEISCVKTSSKQNK